jgi:excisionase family DNA binding protein
VDTANSVDSDAGTKHGTNSPTRTHLRTPEAILKPSPQPLPLYFKRPRMINKVSGQKTIEKRLLTVREAAGYLSTTPMALYQKVWRLQIPFVRLGGKSIRFDKVEIDAWIQKQSVRPINT